MDDLKELIEVIGAEKDTVSICGQCQPAKPCGIPEAEEIDRGFGFSILLPSGRVSLTGNAAEKRPRLPNSN